MKHSINIEVIPGDAYDTVVVTGDVETMRQTVARVDYIEKRWGRWYNVNKLRTDMMYRVAKATALV